MPKQIWNSCFTSYFKELSDRRLNLPTTLLVIYSIPVSMTLSVGCNITYAIVTSPDSSSPWAPIPLINTTALFFAFLFQNIILYSAHPVTGWIADTIIGRAKAITLSLWSCWIAMIIQLISYCIQYSTYGIPVSIAKYALSGLSLIFIMIGTASFFTSVFAYGMDQLVYASSAKLRAFIHWATWGMFTGFLVSYVAFIDTTIYQPTIVMTTTFCISVFLSIVLVLHMFLKDKFLYSGKVMDNPYKMVYQVIKYASEHKFPENRSAFTYWEEDMPGRIDLGKQKYGGPFTEDNVENTKTFWRILAVFCATFGIYIPYFTIVNGIQPYVDIFKDGATAIDGYGAYIAYISLDELILVAVPLMELVIIPLFPKLEFFLTNPLRLMVLSNIFMIFALLSMLVLDTAGSYMTPHSVHCAFAPGMYTYNLSYLWYLCVFIFVGFVSMLNYIGAFELICSQAPSSMVGMLTGMFWFVKAVYMDIGSMIPFSFVVFNWDGPHVGKISCTFWIILLQVVFSIIGLAVLIFAAAKYRKRHRGDRIVPQFIIEDHFEKIIHSRATNFDYEEDDIIEIVSGTVENKDTPKEKKLKIQD